MVPVINFHHSSPMNSPTSASVAIDGAERGNWRFDVDFVAGHYIASAIGPVNEATDAFKVNPPFYFK
jgi:hypothetical protein